MVINAQPWAVGVRRDADVFLSIIPYTQTGRAASGLFHKSGLGAEYLPVVPSQAVSDMLMEEFQKIEKEEKKTAKKKKQK